jgi:CheY-like chemotaxis protein
VVEAHDGRDALVQALADPPALVVTGLDLPIVDGYALCQILRQDPATRGVPILVVAGNGDPEALERVRQAGADRILVAPATPERILEEARALLERPVSGARSPLPPPVSAPEPPARNPLAPAEPSTQAGPRKLSRAKTHQRFVTTTPSLPPPALHCPSCDRQLVYERSHIGGVSDRHPEQWDYYVCPGTCGAFQYRHRTRRVRSMR